MLHSTDGETKAHGGGGGEGTGLGSFSPVYVPLTASRSPLPPCTPPSVCCTPSGLTGPPGTPRAGLNSTTVLHTSRQVPASASPLISASHYGHLAMTAGFPLLSLSA